MGKYGYIRQTKIVSNRKQIMTIIGYQCETIYIENESRNIETELVKLMDNLEKNDCIVVERLAILDKTVKQLSAFLEELVTKECYLISIFEGINKHNMELFIKCIKLVVKSNVECGKNRERKKGKKGGKRRGRPPIDDLMIERIRGLGMKQRTIREIAEECGVSLGTVFKYKD